LRENRSLSQRHAHSQDDLGVLAIHKRAARVLPSERERQLCMRMQCSSDALAAEHRGALSGAPSKRASVRQGEP
jgi:hypothetical protein